MKFKIVTQGGIVYPKPLQLSGDINDLPQDQAAALEQLYHLENKPSDSPALADGIKYNIEITNGAEKRQFALDDSDFSGVPQNVSNLLTFLRNESVRKKFDKP
jgi:hypothetical protein